MTVTLAAFTVFVFKIFLQFFEPEVVRLAAASLQSKGAVCCCISCLCNILPKVCKKAFGINAIITSISSPPYCWPECMLAASHVASW